MSVPSSTRLLPTLARLRPFLRPAVPRFTLGMLSALCAGLCALAIPQVLETMVNGPLLGAIGTGDRSGLVFAVAVVLALGVLEAVLVYARRAFIMNPGTQIEYEMRMSLFRHLQDLPVAFHDRWPGGQLLSRSMADLGMLRRWMSFGLVMLVVNATTVVVGIVLMMRTSFWLGLIYLVGAVPVTLLVYRFSRRLRAISRLSQDQAGDLATTVEESVHGIRVLKAFGRGRTALENFSVQADGLRQTELQKAQSLAGFSFAVTAIPEVVLGICVLVGIWSAVHGDLSVGALVAFFATANVINGPVEGLGQLMSMTLYAKTAVDRYFEVQDAENDLVDPEQPVVLDAVRGELHLDGVRFAYADATAIEHAPDADRVAAGLAEPAREEVLSGIDLTVRPGETMALVGLTGSGKTTLAMLLPRLLDVTAGHVRIDGVDVRDMTRADLRALVSIAFEDASLFSASVRENVLLGAPPGHDTDADVDRALQIAQADFAYRLPQGLDTRIGEEGLSLSGGQRQRLALARAVAARPRVLVLDDPLSALDVATEEAVTERLREELVGITTLVIAHRPSTVALADRVAVLENGRVTAVGTHSELLATHDHYRFVISSLETDAAHERSDA